MNSVVMICHLLIESIIGCDFAALKPPITSLCYMTAKLEKLTMGQAEDLGMSQLLVRVSEVLLTHQFCSSLHEVPQHVTMDVSD